MVFLVTSSHSGSWASWCSWSRSSWTQVDCPVSWCGRCPLMITAIFVTALSEKWLLDFLLLLFQLIPADWAFISWIALVVDNCIIVKVLGLVHFTSVVLNLIVTFSTYTKRWWSTCLQLELIQKSVPRLRTVTWHEPCSSIHCSHSPLSQQSSHEEAASHLQQLNYNL